MRLRSDYHDVYDAAFDGRWRLDKPEYHRMSTTTRTRKQDHDLLEEIGFTCPPRGSVKDLIPKLSPNDFVVLYWDPTKHAADGKSRMQAWTLTLTPRMSDSDDYVCKWVGPTGQSVRILAVGKMIFWLLYTSKTSHFSNMNTDRIDEVLPAMHWGRNAELDVLRLQQKLNQPLLAVDLVIENQKGYAIDLNTAPGLRWTPVVEQLKPQEIHGLIEARWHEVHKS